MNFVETDAFGGTDAFVDHRKAPIDFLFVQTSIFATRLHLLTKLARQDKQTTIMANNTLTDDEFMALAILIGMSERTARNLIYEYVQRLCALLLQGTVRVKTIKTTMPVLRNDVQVFRQRLIDEMPVGCTAIGRRGYQRGELNNYISTPNTRDPAEFKNRALMEGQNTFCEASTERMKY